MFDETLILVETPEPAVVTEIIKGYCADRDIRLEATAVIHPDPFHLVCSLLRRLSNEELGFLKLHGIGDEQRRRVDGLPGPKGATGANVVLQAN